MYLCGIQIMLTEQTCIHSHATIHRSLYLFFAEAQSHTNTLTFLPFLPFPCWAVCHGREVRHHVILQWCVEYIQPRVPRHWMTTNQTSVTGFQQHEKYIEPSARLEMACYAVKNFTAVLRPLHWMSHSFCCCTSWQLSPLLLSVLLLHFVLLI